MSPLLSMEGHQPYNHKHTNQKLEVKSVSSESLPEWDGASNVLESVLESLRSHDLIH